MVNWLKERRDTAPSVYLSAFCWPQHDNFQFSTYEYVTGTHYHLITPDSLSTASLDQGNHILDQYTGSQTGERNAIL